jgi:hypothetical protein
MLIISQTKLNTLLHGMVEDLVVPVAVVMLMIWSQIPQNARNLSLKLRIKCFSFKDSSSFGSTYMN